jgi:hypothetical protein
MQFLVALSAMATVSSAQYLHHPYAFGGKSAPCVNAANVPVPCAAGPGFPFGHYYGKREAEAEPEADAYYGHGYGLGYGHHGYALGLKSAPCVNAANLPVPCASGYHGHYYGKREAEADAAVLYAGHGYPAYAGLGHAGLGYAGLGYAGLGHAAGHAVVATPAGLVHSSHVGLCTNYLGAAVPCRRKREAEADAAVLYAGYGSLAYGYAGLGHAGLGYAGLGHAGLGYAGLGYAGLGHAGLGYAGLGHTAIVAPVATVHNAVLGTAELPNPVHGVAHTPFGAVHSSHVGVCTNYLGEQVSC